MSEEKIPVAIAVRLIDLQVRADASAGVHMVLHEAIALVIAQLHRAGLVDADRFASDLQAAFADPRIADLSPQAAAQAEVLAGRIRGAVHLSSEAGDEPPEGG